MGAIEIQNSIKGVMINNYKSFSNNNNYIDLSNNFNLIIGKNNCGKSSVVDVVEELYGNKKKNGIIDYSLYYSLTENEISSSFNKSVSGGYISGNHYLYGSQFIGKELIIKPRSQNEIVGINGLDVTNNKLNTNRGNIISNWYAAARVITNNIDGGFNFLRLNAERDIIPEVEDRKLMLDENGNGSTNIIREYLNASNYDEKMIEEVILHDLNEIMKDDLQCKGIRIQQIEEKDSTTRRWEIFIHDNNGRYALSKCGSGLKTILLILINIHLISKNKSNNSLNVFAFEEIENNLHPSLQKRLFEYLYKYSVNNNAKMFITSHSPTVINSFYGKKNVGIFHVTKKDGISTISKVDNTTSKLNILDDIGACASDLLQSNGIIWVEGPSDRVYIKNWLEKFCDCRLIEGVDYQFMYYGGRTLSHFTAEEKDNFISILKTNRNAAIVIDSDKKNQTAKINDTKQRIKKEFKNLGLFCWITKGKEIENYLGLDLIKRSFPLEKTKNLKQIDTYELFPDYISKIDKHFVNHKVDFARNVCKNIVKSDENTLDLGIQIKMLYECISKW